MKTPVQVPVGGSAARENEEPSSTLAIGERAVRGRLELGISVRGGRSVASRQFHEGALRVLRPHYLDGSGQVCYVMVNPGGAYLGADLFVVEVEVDAGAELLLTTQSATKIYRTPGSFAEQRMSVRLGEGSRLELMPDQLIAYREASYRQNSHLSLHPTSSLVMAEVITPGWSPDGASFKYEEVRLRNEIWIEDQRGATLLALDNLLIRPPVNDVTGMGFMEGFSHLGSLVVVDPRVDQGLADDLDRISRDFEAYTGVSLTATIAGTTGLVLRSLSNSTEELNTLLGVCSGVLRERWYGQGPLNLRKY
ncbi:urease accessory protein UreD [Arthrobacter sp. YN]|uniref:urease accessory protein UreD n=1 Tax=Arthrobacter sp. YN TaxID=2020486 RepID=UPI000B603009|nr:urease accessory protein [Arthrobacter sp. YN]